MTHHIQNRINMYWGLMIIMCIMNFLFMHYYFVINLLIETSVYLFSFPVNFFSCIFDLSILFIIFLFISKFNTRIALILLFITSWTISFINVFYGRFFMQYIPLSAFAQTWSLTDGIVVDSILSGFIWWDLYYFLTFILFLFVASKMNQQKNISPDDRWFSVFHYPYYQYLVFLFHILLII